MPDISTLKKEVHGREKGGVRIKSISSINCTISCHARLALIETPSLTANEK